MKRKRPIEVLTAQDAESLFVAIPRESPSAKRNRALLALMYGAGLRLRESTAVQIQDIDLEGGRVLVRRGKGARLRTAALPGEASRQMMPWLRARHKFLGDETRTLCPVLWGPTKGRELNSRYVRSMLRRYGDRAGIIKRLHPHSLRHSHACRLADKGVPLHIIQRQLGHSNIATTSLYLDVLAPNQVVDQVRGAWD